jgi:manganese transport protein
LLIKGFVNGLYHYFGYVVRLLYFQKMICLKPVDKVILGLIPSMQNEAALYIAIGIIGATVMPQFVLHSSFANQKIRQSKAGIKQA